MGLNSISSAKALYWLPKDRLDSDVLIPAFSHSTEVNCMTGFFSSNVLSALAPGLATFINQSAGIFKLVISPIVSKEDMQAISDGTKSQDEVVEEILTPMLITKDSLEQHTLECFSYLLRQGRIKINVALAEAGMFHPKVWLFCDDKQDKLAVHGSSNATYSGIKNNIEQISVAKSWEAENQQTAVERLEDEFRELWDNNADYCRVMPIPEAITNKLLKSYDINSPPREIDESYLYPGRQENEEIYQTEIKRDKFSIPVGLVYDKGDFAHQGKAVDAWCANNYNGILEMATGSGKTITSMICAYKLMEKIRPEPLLIILAAPYKPLMAQWCDEIMDFGITPLNMSSCAGERDRKNKLAALRRRLTLYNAVDIAAIVVSQDTLCKQDFKDEIKKFNCAKLLIGDEVHNLGREGFINNPPDFIEYRLGLSATPVRQYDIKGTEHLMEYFGPIVFKFTLEEAIGKCLVGYNYHVHPVELTEDEMEEWEEITAKLRRSYWSEEEEPSEYATQLMIKRRRIIENASNKIQKLAEVLAEEDIHNLSHTLIYASDKAPGQLQEINAMLDEKGINYHQITAEESNNAGMIKDIISEFKKGDKKIITAKRVLDEGVNIPEIKKAFIVASSATERQWVQRRGRLLRKCYSIGKEHSEIHDFLTLPPTKGTLDRDSRGLLESELKRIEEFANLSYNIKEEGPLRNLIHELTKRTYG